MNLMLKAQLKTEYNHQKMTLETVDSPFSSPPRATYRFVGVWAASRTSPPSEFSVFDDGDRGSDDVDELAAAKQ